MKRWCLFLILTISGLFLLGSHTVVHAQCETEPFVQEALNFLKEKNFNFLKSYKIDGQKGANKEVEYSYVFSTGTTYMIFVNNGRKNAEGVIITVEDAERNEIAKSFVGDTYVPAVQIICNRTGIYYLRFTLVDKKHDCAAAVLGFKR